MDWKLAFVMTLLGAAGSVTLSWLALPMLIEPSSLPVSVDVLKAATAVQSIVLVFLASIVGTRLAPRVELASPFLSGLLAGRDASAALRRQFLPALAGGVIGAGVLIAFHGLATGQASALKQQPVLPLVVRILYGGITEEILVRWGLMTLLAWLGWRLFQKGNGPVSANIAWCAIALSALVFGLSHLPAASAAIGTLTTSTAAYITLGNAVFGGVAGYLFWRYGLESAMMAHMLAHALAFMVRA